MRLSSFAYRITTQDWVNLSALHSSHFYYLNFAVYVWANQAARELLLTDKPVAVCKSSVSKLQSFVDQL